MEGRLQVLQVGCGDISRLWLDPLRDSPQATVVGFVDLDADLAVATARRYGGSALAGDDLLAMLAATRPDVVFDGTVPGAHRDVTITALEAGCHVFGEKPMADSRRTALEMIAAARTHGRTYAVMQNRRFHPSIRSLRDVLAEDHIGRMTTVHADFVIAPHFGGIREAMRHVLLRDMAIHTFDSARFFAGEAPLVAHGMSWNPEGSRVTY